MKPEENRPDNVHKQHRQRMRERILETDLISLADHEVLEVLLYYGLPRRDTNLLAHKLLEHYGSLDRVLDADPRDLVKQEGIGENAAFLLHFAALLSARYVQSKTRQRSVYGSTKAIASYVSSLFLKEVREVVYLLCLDNSMRLITSIRLAEGSVDGVSVPVAEVVRQAIVHTAKNVVLAHNHPSGCCKPSNDDLRLTQCCLTALAVVNIALLDHLVISGTSYFSFSEHGYMGTMKLAPEGRIPF